MATQPPPKRLTKPVIFTISAEEQALLKAIDHALKSKQFSTFSELCKHALRQLLLSTPTMPLSIEQRMTQLETQLTELTARLSVVEAKFDEPIQEETIIEEVPPDPVLDRLRPLLEDF